MARKKINLAVIFSGGKRGHKANQKQFVYLKNNLSDFSLRKYNFDKNEQAKLLDDFIQGKVDVVLKNAYGRGHEAMAEVFLEQNRIPYFGSSANSTFIATSKFLAKQVFRQSGLPVVDDAYVDNKLWAKDKKYIVDLIKKKIGFPCLIKDIGGTDSRGIYKVDSLSRLEKSLNKAIARHSGVIVEKFISQAYEAVCLAVGNDYPEIYTPLGINKASQKIFSVKMKNGVSMINFDVPAKLSPRLTKQVKKITKRAHQALNCRTFSRADIIIAKNKLYILEADVHTGFSENSAATVMARYQGENINDLFLKFYRLIEKRQAGPKDGK